MAVSLGYENVYRYPQGFPEWKDNGLPIEETDSLRVLELQAALSSENNIPSGLTLLWIMFGVFIGGMALNLTPCVYPLIPITVSYFGGHSSQSQGKLVIHGLSYVAGLALTNSTLGVLAALTGGLMGSLLQNTWVLVGVAIVLLIFSSSLFGLWDLKLPQGLMRAASKSYAGYFGTLFMGLTLGIIAAPCIGPFVLGLLTWIASIGSVWFGFIVFFVLSLGLGLPLFLLALFSGRLENLPRSGEWMAWVRKLMGWILIGMSTYFLRPLLQKNISIILYIFIALAAGVHLALVDQSRATFKGFSLIKNGIGVLCIALAVFLAGPLLLRQPGVAWQAFSVVSMEQAKQQNLPVIMDFYASWCAPCRKLDDVTFHDPKVVETSKKFLMLKIDLTKKGDVQFRKLVQDYNVKGVPTVVFLDGRGKERLDLRLIDYMKPDDFFKHMKKAL